MATTETGGPARGDSVYDQSSGRYGTVADTEISPGWIYVRPIGGGIEWRARPEHLRPASTSDLLADRLRVARTSTGGDT